MSQITYHTPKYTLIDKTNLTVTPIDILGDATTGNLTSHRSSCKFNEVIGKAGIPNATMVLRAPAGLFHTNGPILTDELTKGKFLIDIQIFQPSDIGGGGEDNEGLASRLFRMEITSATYDKGAKGEHVSLTLTNYDIRLEELLDAERLELQTPKQAFISRTLNAGEQRIDEGPLFIILDIGDTSLDLPDDDRLKQDWIPTKPTPIKDLLDDIIDKISKPEQIGTLNRDFYWFTIASPTATNQFILTAKQFGEIDSGVILKDVDLTTPNEQLEFTKQSGTDNSRFKNLLIGRCQPGSHSFPMDFTRLASDLTHAKIAAFWNIAAIEYLKGDYVKSGNQYFKANINNTSNAGNEPSIDSVTWENLSTTTKGSPWTLDSEVWRKNLAGHESPPAGFVGFFNDFNIVRVNYDRNDEFDEFEKISVKDIEDYIDDPSTILTDELKSGRRWLVKIGVGDWAGQDGKIAARNNNAWVFSVLPTDGDIVNDLKLGKVRGYSAGAKAIAIIGGAETVIAISVTHRGVGYIIPPAVTLTGGGGTGATATAVLVGGMVDSITVDNPGNNYTSFPTVTIANQPTPAWEIIWDLEVNPDKASCFHPVKSITIVPNRRNLNKAVKFRFDWNTFEESTIQQILANMIILSNPVEQTLRLLAQSVADFVGPTGQDLLDFLGLVDNTKLLTAFGIGSNANLAGRWCGWSIKAPFPRNATATKDVGHFLKKPFLDFENLHRTLDKDTAGWNQAIDTENLGGIKGLAYWVNNTFYDKRDIPINGMADIPYIHWWRDISDRIVYSETKIPAHDRWQKIKVQAGPKANLQLHDSRIDELFKLFGFTFPDNFFIAERELTGVKFDWRRVKEFGCFYQGSYDDNFFYKGAQAAFLDNFMEHVTQRFKNASTNLTLGFLDQETVVVDHVEYILDDIRFLKDAYVVSSDVPVTDLRQKLIDLPGQFDYINIKTILDKLKSRFEFHPGINVFDCRGDVRLRAGQFFTVDDSTSNLVKITPVKVSHIDDVNGYNCQLVAVFKYEVPT